MRYEEVDTGSEVVSIAEAKRYMRLTSKSADEDLSLILSACTSYGEHYTGRDFRANTYALHLDSFEARICLRKSPVASIVSITRDVATVATAVPSADYYLKRGARFAEVLLADGASWPTDQDSIEDTITVNFLTEASKNPEVYKLAILKHASYAFENRGDDPMPIGANTQRQGAILGFEGATASGAMGLYLTLRIPRI